ncbi:serine/threonine-protein kinase 10-like [Cylas formicarius]|uniref:serine/threonine-protein kinase 10-like n=1 Tax=Cylas formicarius TaxID=197179 RepID=UPI002958D8E0|nr:serine/threonine-protein kinase 10-like [Cylas formicarius]
MLPKQQIRMEAEQDIQETIAMVKQYWPDYSITPDLLKKPTREFVLTFYSDCVENIRQKISHITGIDLSPNPQNLELESYLYWKLREIPSMDELKLGDLYKFNPLRTRQFIKLIIHFLTYTELYMEVPVAIAQNRIEISRVMETQTKELNDFQELKQQKISQVGLLVRETQELSKKSNTVDVLYKKNIPKKVELEKERKEKNMQLTKLNEDFIKNETTLQHYEEKEDHLRNEITTVQEYKDLINIREMLKMEEITETAAVKDHHDGLQQCKNTLGPLRVVSNKLNDLSITNGVFGVVVCRQENENLKQRIMCLWDQQKNKENTQKVLDKRLQNERKNLEQTLQRTVKTLESEMAKNTVDKVKIKSQYQDKEAHNKLKLEEVLGQIKHIEEETEKLKKGFKLQYDRMRELQQTCTKKAVETMERINENIE